MATLDTSYIADGTAIVTDADDDAARYVVWQDDDAESPNDWNNDRAYVYRTSPYGSADDDNGDDVASVFFRVYSEHGDDALALTVTRRYARVFLGWTAQQAGDGIDTYTARGYSQSDWWDILSVSPNGYAEVHAQTWEQWARGDVFTVMRETRIECDPEECHGDDDAHWTPGDACSGIYADDAEEAVTHAMGNGLS